MIYLDHAAAALPHKDIIIGAYTKSFEYFANPSAKHDKGKEARNLLEENRAQVADILKTDSKRIVFTSGGSESNSIAILSVLTHLEPCSIAISNIEHPACLRQADKLKNLGYKILTIPSDSNGFITAQAVLKTIQEDTAFVSVMGVNNETGAIQPIAEIGEALKSYSKGKRFIHFHTDAVQALGKIPVDVSSLPIHSLSFSGHKIGAPRGIGLLYLAKEITPFFLSGGQENGMRSGTENVAGVLALTECLRLTLNNQKEWLANAELLMNFLIAELNEIKGVTIIPNDRINNKAHFSPWVLQFATDKLPGEVLVRCLSEKGIYISTGSACSSKKSTRPILDAMNIPDDVKRNAARVSIGRSTTKSEIETFITTLKIILESV